MKPESNPNVIEMRSRSGYADQPRIFPEAIGHEKILAGCKKNQTQMRLVLRDKSLAVGVITQFDRWTITLKGDDDNRRTFFKHDLSSFEAVN